MDCGFGSLTLKSSWCDPFITFDKMYFEFDRKLETCEVLGGEICMWSELNNDNNILQKIWLRASAASERFWSKDIE